jgi:hypothetical protein
MKRVIMIIPANKCDEANDWLVSEFGDTAKDTFLPSINSSGNRKDMATHAICDWMLPKSDFIKVTDELGKPEYQSEWAEGMPYLDEPTVGKKTGRGFMAEKGLKRRADRG